MSINLHYHQEHARRPTGQPTWRNIPPGTWVRGCGFWARRAFDDHIYDILVDDNVNIYFWRDVGDGWFVHEAPHACGTVEEAMAYASVYLRMSEKPSTE